jgi:hypothetical protein
VHARLHRHDHDAGWLALARSFGISDDAARRLRARAESDATHGPEQVERVFRRLLAEAQALDALAIGLETDRPASSHPGKWTRVLVEERLTGGTADPASHHGEPSELSPATRLRHALEAAVHSGESAARAIAGSDAKTITEALRRLRDGQGSGTLAGIELGSLTPVLRLTDALVTLVGQGRDEAPAGKPLPGDLRGELESRLGVGFGDVRVHDDPAAAVQARRHDAVAFAQGTDVFFADGKYDPSSPAGRRLIAHEVTHVAQQRGGSPATVGSRSEPGSAVEREADRVATAFAAGLAPGAPAFAVTERAAAGTISRDTAPPATTPGATTPAAPKEWKINLLGQVLDLSSKLATATDAGGGKRIDINQSIGPLRIQQATFTASGDKVSSGTLVASIDSGPFKSTTGTLTVDSSGNVSGTLTLPINVPGLLVKQVSVEVGGGAVNTKVKLAPTDFQSPELSVKTSDFELSVGFKTGGGGVDVGLTGSAEVAIDNGMAQGQAKLDIDLKVGGDGVTFNAKITGELSIAGLVPNVNTVITYDGKTIKFDAGATVPVKLPGLAGTADIKYEKGKLSIDSKDLHFTLPQLAPVNFEEVHVDQSKLAAKLSLTSPIQVPLPGGASLTLEQSSISIDGTAVNGDITGTFALNKPGGLTGKVQLSYQQSGDIAGSVTIAGGATFTFAGVTIAIDNGSTLSVEKGMGVSGDVAGTVKIPGIPDIAVHVVAKTGEPIDLTCDATIQLQSIVKQLAGDLHVQYRRGGGAHAFSFEATDIAVFAPPLNGQVLFSNLNAQLKGNELTGSLTAKGGTVITVGSTSVTITGGLITLLPGKILDGQLQAQSHTDNAAPGGAGGTAVEAAVGWDHGKFTWSAEGNFDLGQLTNSLLLGTVRAAAGSNGTGEFQSVGEITFGVPALKGIKIAKLSGNKQTATFSATIHASDAANAYLAKLQGVDVQVKAGDVTVAYADRSLTFNGEISGTATYPKGAPSQLEGNFHLKYDSKAGFTGSLDGVKLTASEYFKSDHGTANLETGDVQLGAATFSVPGVCEGTVTTAQINLKSNKFHVEAQVSPTVPALAGLKIKIALDNQTVTASLAANTPPIPLGTFATLTVGDGTQVSLSKETGLSVHMSGQVTASTMGTGKFQLNYDNKKLSGSAQIKFNPLAMFNAFQIVVDIDDKGEATTQSPIDLSLAPQYEGTFVAEAKVSVAKNELKITGKLSEIKNLGSISDAFNKGGGTTITYDQASRQVRVHDEINVAAVMPQLDTGSVLTLDSVNKTFTISGTLKPKTYGPVAFTSASHITASWSSDTKRLDVTGTAQADIANLCQASFTVDAGLGGGQPGSFGLKGHIDATQLAAKIPGVTFSSVTSDFSVVIGQGAQAPLNFHLHAQVSGIPAAGVSDISASLDADYTSGQGLIGQLAVTKAKLGDVLADGNLQFEKGRIKSGQIHLEADFPGLKVEGTGTVAAAEMGELTTTAELKVTPGGGSALSQFIQSGNIHVDIQKWKLTNAVGQLQLKPPSFLPIENTVIEVGYKPGTGIHATLSTQFNAPLAKHGEKGTFTAGYEQGRGLYAHIEFPMTVPGFQAATVSGDLDGQGIRIGATLIPKDTTIVKEANVQIGYDFGSGFYLQGSITLKPSEQLELVVGVRYEQNKGLEIMGITPNDKAATPDEHEVAHWKKTFPTIPLATVGVASLGLQFGLGVAAGYRMPRIKFQRPQLEGGLDALDKGGMPAFTFGGQIAMGAYITLSLSVEVVGEIQLLIATADAGIGAEIAARLNLELGADVDGRFAPGQGALLHIDPFVGASLDLIASLIATLHASICWFTIIDKKWTLASANFAHIDLGQFHPFNPVGLQIGGPGGTHLTNGLTLRDDAFDQITSGVKHGGEHAGDDEANEDARNHVRPVLQAFRNASHQFEQLPPGWERGMTAAPVDFHSMFPVKDDEWDYYQDHADTAEQIDPADACTTPTQKLAKAVGVTARKDPGGAGRLILAWRRAQIAHMGIDPDTGVNVVQEREEVQVLIEAKYQADLAAAQQKQKQQDEEYAHHVEKQQSDYQKAETTHEKTAQQQKTAHDQSVTKTQGEWTKAQDQKVTAAKTAQKEGAQVTAVDQQKAPPPPTPPAPPAPKPLAKPAPIPKPPPVPMPPPPEVLPAVTLPALPTDPGVSVHAAAAIPPSQGAKPKAESPGAKQAPTGGSPDPMPGTSSNAKQAGGGGGTPMPGGKSGGGGQPSGGSTSAAPRPGPVVAAGPDGIISQEKTLDAKKQQLTGGAAAGKPGKPGLLGKLGLPGLPGAATPTAAGKPAAGAPGAATPTAAGKPGAAPGTNPAPGAATPTSGGIDPTVQKVVDQGHADEASYKQKLTDQSHSYDTKITEQDKHTADETEKLKKEAEAAKRRKELEKAAAAGQPGAHPLGPDGKPEKPKDVGIRVALSVDGESHTLYIESGMAMVASTPTTVTAKLAEAGASINHAPGIKPLASASVQDAQGHAQKVASLAAKATGGDAAANSALAGEQQSLAIPLKRTWEWDKVSRDPAVTSGSIENPLLHPYYPTFKTRVATLSDKGHIHVDATPFAEQTWTKLCKAVKAAHPAMTDPKAYSDFARGWIDMKSPEFQKAIHEFDSLGAQIGKAASSQLARARHFGFWSKDEGRTLAEQISDLTLETSAIGSLMDGLPTLDAKGAGWDPEVWGALSNAYATAVVPEIVKGKKINVCIGANVPSGNIWETVESAALHKGLKEAGLSLEHVSTHYAAAAKSTTDRKSLDTSKHTNGIAGCLYVGDRPGAIAAANAHFAALSKDPGKPTSADPAGATPATPAAPQKSEVPLTMKGESHHLILTSGPAPKIEMASTIGVFLGKVDKLISDLGALNPPPTAQITALTHLRTQASALERVLAGVQAANASLPAGGKPQQDPSNSPEAQALVAAIVAYGNAYDATDLDILADPRTPLRKHAGYAWLAAKGLAVDFETRILTQLASFTKARIERILTQIARFQGQPAFEAKVVKAVSSNAFWSPNDGFFFEIEDLASIANIRFFDVPVGGKTIDILTGDGILIDQKYEVAMDPSNPAQLKGGIKGQLQAMQHAVGTVVQGITVKDYRFHIHGSIDAQVKAYLATNGLTAHFVAR